MSAVELVHLTPPDEHGVGIVEICRPPENYLTVFVLRELVERMAELDGDPGCGAILVRSEGKHFCAGRDWGEARSAEDTAEAIYAAASVLLDFNKPWVAELTGGSIGAGMGLALCADYRIAAESAYVCAKFVDIGIHHGFGLSATLPWLVGPQRATEILSSGRRVPMTEAIRIGLVDRVAPIDALSTDAHAFAASLAAKPGRALEAIRSTMRADLRASFQSALVAERAAQAALYDSPEFQGSTGGGYRYDTAP